MALLSDSNALALIGLGSGLLALLGTVVPLLFKFLASQQDLKRELIHNTKVTVAASEKIDVANDISGKLLSTNKNIEAAQATMKENREAIQALQAANGTKNPTRIG